MGCNSVVSLGAWTVELKVVHKAARLDMMLVVVLARKMVDYLGLHSVDLRGQQWADCWALKWVVKKGQMTVEHSVLLLVALLVAI